VIGQRHRLIRRQDGILGRSSIRASPCGIPNPHAFADASRRDVRAHGVDRSGAIAMRNDLRKRQSTGARPCASFHVRWIDTDQASFTRTAFGPGVGVGTSVTRSTSLAGPVRSYIATRMMLHCRKSKESNRDRSAGGGQRRRTFAPHRFSARGTDPWLE